MNRAIFQRPLQLRTRTLTPRQLRPLFQRSPLQSFPLHRTTLRHASTTSSELATDTRSVATRLKNLFLGTSLILIFSFGYLYTTDTRASIHSWLAVPLLRLLYADAEDAHHAGTSLLSALYQFGLQPRERGTPDLDGKLSVEVFGEVLDNPIGTSAGIDKNGEIPDPLMELGPGIVEIGAVTPIPQAGNAKPRVFRLPSQNALINRYGFNSQGAEAVAARLRQRVREFALKLGWGSGEEAERRVLDGEAGVRAGSLRRGKLLAVQVAKHKDTHESDIEAVAKDYVTGVQLLGRYADIIVVNVSSPNTPGLRTLQNVEPLTRILTSVVHATQAVGRKRKPAVMVKVSPDEDSVEQVSGICEAVWDSGVDGVIVGNTTKRRPDPLPKGYVLPAKEAELLLEQGGYSGPQMFDRTLALVKRYRAGLDEGPKLPEVEKEEQGKEGHSLVSGHSTGEQVESSVLEKLAPGKTATKEPGAEAMKRKVIFATGGITNGKQALEVLDAGASVAMVYTAMIYSGAGTISRIKGEMREELGKR